MNRSWFYKLLFSYLPVFFIVISFLIAVFFFSMGEVTRMAAETVNRGSSNHMLELIDHSLQSIEHMMIKELGTQDGIQRFYNRTLRDDPYKSMALPSKELWNIVTQYPMIQSVYLVRWEDRVILSDSATLSWDQFEDRPFVESYLQTRQGFKWTGLRPYREFANQYRSDVITLVKPYPVPAGDEGIMVVNVSAKWVTELVDKMYDTDFISAAVEDRNGNALIASASDKPVFEDTVTEVQSEYSGLIIKSQLAGGAFYQFATRAIAVLLFSGFIAIVAAVFYITYISKRNYRPIRSLMTRLDGYARLKAEQLLKSGGKDEFAYIENALDKMIEQAGDLMSQQEEHLQARKRQWIKDTLEGDFDAAGKCPPEDSEPFGWNPAHDKASAIVIEIDRYADFCENYTKRDQSLLKFLIGNVVAEMAQQHEIGIFGEWLFPQKWCAFVQLKDDHATEDVVVFALQIVAWIRDNLDFNVTIGLGDLVLGAGNINVSYEQSLHVLQYKMTLGNNRVIGYWEVPESQKQGTRKMGIDMMGLVQSYKLGEADWEEHYDRFIRELQTEVWPRDELVHQIHFLIYQLSREFLELNADYRELWHEHTVPRINRLMKQFDTFDEMSEGLRTVLLDAYRQLAELREERTYSSTMKDVRQYIYDNYSNPDLSLNHLSAAFNLKPKYVSHLFKEEFGEKFVDYLMNVRMEKAKELLASTELSVQEIAVQVGYTHSFSFIRVFKKTFGITPGDYRKQLA